MKLHTAPFNLIKKIKIWVKSKEPSWLIPTVVRVVPCVWRHAPKTLSSWQRKLMSTVIRMWRLSEETIALDVLRALSFALTDVFLFIKNEWRIKSYGRTRSNFIEG